MSTEVRIITPSGVTVSRVTLRDGDMVQLVGDIPHVERRLVGGRVYRAHLDPEEMLTPEERLRIKAAIWAAVRDHEKPREEILRDIETAVETMAPSRASLIADHAEVCLCPAKAGGLSVCAVHAGLPNRLRHGSFLACEPHNHESALAGRCEDPICPKPHNPGGGHVDPEPGAFDERAEVTVKRSDAIAASETLLARDEEINDLKNELRQVSEHRDMLIADRALEKHVHVWRYSKAMTDNVDPRFRGRYHTLWSWECVDGEVDGKEPACGGGKSATNTAGHVPDHFPRELR